MLSIIKKIVKSEMTYLLLLGILLFVVIFILWLTHMIQKLLVLSKL